VGHFFASILAEDILERCTFIKGTANILQIEIPIENKHFNVDYKLCYLLSNFVNNVIGQIFKMN
jgi:hypothetical protein